MRCFFKRSSASLVFGLDRKRRAFCVLDMLHHPVAEAASLRVIGDVESLRPELGWGAGEPFSDKTTIASDHCIVNVIKSHSVLGPLPSRNSILTADTYEVAVS